VVEWERYRCNSALQVLKKVTIKGTNERESWLKQEKKENGMAKLLRGKKCHLVSRNGSGRVHEKTLESKENFHHIVTFYKGANEN